TCDTSAFYSLYSSESLTCQDFRPVSVQLTWTGHASTPLDPECPKTAPNYYDASVNAMEISSNECGTWRNQIPKRFNSNVSPLPETKSQQDGPSHLTESILNDIFGRKKRDTTATKKPTNSEKSNPKDEDYYAYEDSDYDVTGIQNANVSFQEEDGPQRADVPGIWRIAVEMDEVTERKCRKILTMIRL
ncbi:hypothetical protein COOONC_23118, partial [Cooperia oncophora]